MALDFVSIRGDIYSHKSVLARLDNEELDGQMVSADWEQKRDRKLVEGGNRTGVALGMTGGAYKPEPLALTVLRAMALSVKAYLAQKDGSSSYGAAEFTFQIQLVEKNDDVITTTFRNCRIVGDKNGSKVGPDELTTDMTILYKSIVENVNGVDLILFDAEDDA